VGVSGVKVDASDAMKRLKGIEDAVGRKGMRRLERKGVFLMRASVQESFASKKDPSTGRAWQARKQPASNPMLYKTGELMGFIKTIGKVWRGNYASRLYLKFGLPDQRHALIKAGSLFHGRSKARSSKGTRLKGYLPESGYMPGRPYMGMTRSARSQLKSEAKRLLRKRS
jgi:phage gpG-like protein